MSVAHVGRNIDTPCILICLTASTRASIEFQHVLHASRAEGLRPWTSTLFPRRGGLPRGPSTGPLSLSPIWFLTASCFSSQEAQRRKVAAMEMPGPLLRILWRLFVSAPKSIGDKCAAMDDSQATNLPVVRYGYNDRSGPRTCRSAQMRNF